MREGTYIVRSAAWRQPGAAAGAFAPLPLAHGTLRLADGYCTAVLILHDEALCSTFEEIAEKGRCVDVQVTVSLRDEPLLLGGAPMVWRTDGTCVLRVTSAPIREAAAA